MQVAEVGQLIVEVLPVQAVQAVEELVLMVAL
jgi:hypothetical protein